MPRAEMHGAHPPTHSSVGCSFGTCSPPPSYKSQRSETKLGLARAQRPEEGDRVNWPWALCWEGCGRGLRPVVSAWRPG